MDSIIMLGSIIAIISAYKVHGFIDRALTEGDKKMEQIFKEELERPIPALILIESEFDGTIIYKPISKYRLIDLTGDETEFTLTHN